VQSIPKNAVLPAPINFYCSSGSGSSPSRQQSSSSERLLPRLKKLGTWPRPTGISRQLLLVREDGCLLSRNLLVREDGCLLRSTSKLACDGASSGLGFGGGGKSRY